MTARFDQYLPFGRPSFSEEEIEAVAQTMRSGWVGQGRQCQSFEKELAEYCEAKEAVLLNSCTSALFLSLKELGVGPGDEVICPSFTWYSTANAALYLGARVVFADIDYETMCVTPDSIKRCLTPATKAVVVVHLGGYAVDVRQVREALPHSVAIVEDAAHAIGARYSDGSPIGSSGNLTCFSFYANKNLSTGEGGAILLNEVSQAKHFRQLRLHALNLDAWKRFTSSKSLLVSNPLEELGYKMNYTDMQASIGRVQLRRLGEFGAIRKAIAAKYVERLPSVLPGVGFQASCVSNYHSRHLFLIRLPLDRMPFEREGFVERLRDRNIGASIHYTPLHWMPLYEAKGDLPVTEAVFKEIVTLPISASMNVGDAEVVVDAIKEILEDE